ncbi:uncharacterized protein EDB93DRAFT_1108850, partial [Suillus bovinus]|uniref:uncharacterized protein n=1 Tax=Suillus bovinus TaxID=48563 RepID=UPI001B866C7A
MADSALLVDGLDESDTVKEQQCVRAAGKRKVHEDSDSEDNPPQLKCPHPTNMSSHISLVAPVVYRTANDLTPAFLKDAKFHISKPNFIWWFITICSYQVSACARKMVACGYLPIAEGTQSNFKFIACCNERGGICSWFQDLLEAYIHKAYQLDVGEARVLASLKENDPQEPTVRCFDDESQERVKDLKTIISWEHPCRRKRGSRVGLAQHNLPQK